MLAQNFKTAAELGISEGEVDALIKVLGMLEREEFSFARKLASLMYEPTSEFSFHMAISNERHDCGTISCIGGWVATFMGDRDPFDYVNYTRTPRLTELYWPRAHLMDDITPAIAAIALRSFLTTGRANWSEALSLTSHQGRDP